MRNNLREEMNPEWDCIVSKNTCFQQIFMETEKKRKEIFLLYEKHKKKSNFDLPKNREHTYL